MNLKYENTNFSYFQKVLKVISSFFLMVNFLVNYSKLKVLVIRFLYFGTIHHCNTFYNCNRLKLYLGDDFCNSILSTNFELSL